MNLEELKVKRTELLDAISKIKCAHESAAYSKELSSCPTCLEIRGLGKQYEAVQRQIKDVEGRPIIIEEPKERAKRINIPNHIRELALEHGVSYATLRQRLRRGIEPTQAATEPVGKKSEHEEFQALAERNGIRPDTFRRRLRETNMSPEEAATKPLRRTLKRA